MVSAVVLIKAEPQMINEVAEKLAALDGCSEVFSVAGRYDLVAIARVTRNDELADLISVRMAKVGGIVSLETLIAFKMYSRDELESAFSVGMEE
ncbi:MAG: Lrp/AsnC ligand binding domain-containing protein [Gammaproteobacteria bacterium]|nr:Lrp/AsnC ligand binding domain-containing protein [Gammaproteobacteria bacterium]